MTVPAENYSAFFPPSVTVGKVVLRPLTLAGAVRIAHTGADISRRVSEDRLVAVAAVLAGMSVPTFANHYKGGLRELSDAVEGLLNDAFATFIRPRTDDAKNAPKHLTPHGIGWPLESAEFLCATYGWTWAEAIETPVATVFALAAAARERMGGKHGGLDYMERKYRADLKAGKVAPVKIGGGGKGKAE